MQTKQTKNNRPLVAGTRGARAVGRCSKPGMRPMLLMLVATIHCGLVHPLWSASLPPATVKGPALERINGGIRLKYVADEKAYGEVWVYDREWKNRSVPDSRKALLKVPEAKFVRLPNRKPSGKMVPHTRDISFTGLKPGKQYWYEFSVDVPNFALFRTNGTFTTSVRID